MSDVDDTRCGHDRNLACSHGMQVYQLSWLRTIGRWPDSMKQSFIHVLDQRPYDGIERRFIRES